MPLSDSEIRLIWVHVHVLLKMLADLNYDVMYVSCNTNGVQKKKTLLVVLLTNTKKRIADTLHT